MKDVEKIIDQAMRFLCPVEVSPGAPKRNGSCYSDGQQYLEASWRRCFISLASFLDISSLMRSSPLDGCSFDDRDRISTKAAAFLGLAHIWSSFSTHSTLTDSPIGIAVYILDSLHR